MIKVVLVRFDGSPSDDFRFAAAESLAKLFDAHVEGLFFNLLPEPILAEQNMSTELWTRMLQEAHDTGDEIERRLRKRLAGLVRSHDLRRFDVYPHERPVIASREARTADVFVGLRLSDTDAFVELRDVIEEVLFDSGRHLFLVVDEQPYEQGFDHALVAWNGSREASRALAEARPYLRKARMVTVLTVGRKDDLPEMAARPGEAVVRYLAHHGIPSSHEHVEGRGIDAATVITTEVGEKKVDLLVMGGYGHSRIREWLLGGTTYKLLRRAPVSLVIAH